MKLDFTSVWQYWPFLYHGALLTLKIDVYKRQVYYGTGIILDREHVKVAPAEEAGDRPDQIILETSHILIATGSVPVTLFYVAVLPDFSFACVSFLQPTGAGKKVFVYKNINLLLTFFFP